MSDSNKADPKQGYLWADPWPDVPKWEADTGLVDPAQPQVAPEQTQVAPAEEAESQPAYDFGSLYSEPLPTPTVENVPEVSAPAETPQDQAAPTAEPQNLTAPAAPAAPTGPMTDQELTEANALLMEFSGMERLSGASGGLGSLSEDNTVQFSGSLESLYRDPLQGIPMLHDVNKGTLAGEPIEVSPGQYIWQYIEAQPDPEGRSYRTIGQALQSQFGNPDYHRHLARKGRIVVEQNIVTPIDEQTGRPKMPYAAGAKRLLYPNLANLQDWGQGETKRSFDELPRDRQQLYTDAADPSLLALSRAFAETKTEANPEGDLLAAARAWEDYLPPESDLVEARAGWQRIKSLYDIESDNRGLYIKSKNVSPEMFQRALSLKIQQPALSENIAPEMSGTIPEEFTSPSLASSIMDAFYNTQKSAGFDPTARLSMSINGRPVNDYFSLDWSEDNKLNRVRQVALGGNGVMTTLDGAPSSWRTDDYRASIARELYGHQAYTAIVAALTPNDHLTSGNPYFNQGFDVKSDSRLVAALQIEGAPSRLGGLTPSEQTEVGMGLDPAVPQDPLEIAKAEIRLAGGHHLVISGQRRHLRSLALQLIPVQTSLRSAINQFAALPNDAIPVPLQNQPAFVPEGRVNELYTNLGIKRKLESNLRNLVAQHNREPSDELVREIEVVQYRLGLRRPWHVREFIERAVNSEASIQETDAQDVITPLGAGEWVPHPDGFKIEEPIWIVPGTGLSEKELGRVEFRNLERVQSEEIAPFQTGRWIELASKIGSNLYGSPVYNRLDVSQLLDSPTFVAEQRDVLKPEEIKAATGGTPVDSYGNVVFPSQEEIAAAGISDEVLADLAERGKAHNSRGVPRITRLEQEAIKDAVALWQRTGQTPVQDIHNYIQDITGYELVSPAEWEENEKSVLAQAFHRLGWGFDIVRREFQLGIMLGQEFVGLVTPEIYDDFSREKYFQIIFRDFDFEDDPKAEALAREVAARYNDVLWGEVDFTESAIAHSYTGNADTVGFEVPGEGDFKMFNPSVKYYFDYAISPEQAYYLDQFAPSSHPSWQWRVMRSPVAKEVIEMGSWLVFDPLLFGGLGRSAKVMQVGDEVLVAGGRFSQLSRDLAILSEKAGHVGLKGEHAWGQMLAETQQAVRKLQEGGLSTGERLALEAQVRGNVQTIQQLLGETRVAAAELRSSGQRLVQAGEDLKSSGGTPTPGSAAADIVDEYTQAVKAEEGLRDALGSLQKPASELGTEAERVQHAARIREAETRVSKAQAELAEITNPQSAHRWFKRNGTRRVRSANKMEHMANDVEHTLTFLKGERELNGMLRAGGIGGFTYGARVPNWVPGVGGKRIPLTRERQLLRKKGRLAVHLPVYGTSRTLDLIPNSLARKLGWHLTPDQVARHMPIGTRPLGSVLQETRAGLREQDLAARQAAIGAWEESRKAHEMRSLTQKWAAKPHPMVERAWFNGVSEAPSWLRNPFDTYKGIDEALTAGTYQFADLTTYEKFLWLGGWSGTKVGTFPAHIYELFRKTFGTTAMRPLIDRTSNSLVHRVPAVIWDTYVDAMRAFTRKQQYMESQLIHQVDRLTRNALDASQRLSKEAKTAIPNLTREIAKRELSKADASLSAKEVAAIDAEIKALEVALLRYKEYAAPSFNARVVLQMAADEIETGAGLLKNRPELAGIVADVQKLIEDYAAGVAVEEGALRQALALMQRGVRADPEHLASVQSMMTLARNLIDHPEVVALDRMVDLRKMYGSAARQRAAVRGLLDRATPEQLADLLEQVRAKDLGQMIEEGQRAWLHKIITDTFEGNQAAVRGFEEALKTSMGVRDVHLAVRKLLTYMRATKNGLRWSKDFAKVTSDMVRNTVLRLDAEAKNIERFLVGEVTDFLIGEVKVSLDSSVEELRNVSAILADEHFITAQAIIGSEAWGGFREWVKTGEGTIPTGKIRDYDRARSHMERYVLMRDIVPSETAREAAILSSVMDSAEALAIKQRIREVAADTRMSPQEIEALMVVSDGRALSWALETGLAPSEWWAHTFAGIRKGRGRLPADTLFQVHEGAAPAFYSELRLFVEKEWPTRRGEAKMLTGEEVVDFVTQKRAKVKSEELVDNELLAILMDTPSERFSQRQVLDLIDANTMPISVRSSETVIGPAPDPWAFIEGTPGKQFSRRGDPISSRLMTASEPEVGAMYSPAEIFTVEGRNRQVTQVTAQGSPEVLSLPGSSHEMEVLLVANPNSNRISMYPEWETVMGVRDGLLSKHTEGGHWPVDNVISHFRAGVREVTTQDGRTIRTLHLAELQSDFHKWAKEQGYGGEIPHGPFKKSWLSLTMKAATRKAAEMGLDGVSFDTGATQILRYKGPDIAYLGDRLTVKVHQLGPNSYQRSASWAIDEPSLVPQSWEPYLKRKKEGEALERADLFQELGRSNAKRLDDTDGNPFMPTADEFASLEAELSRLGDELGASFAYDFITAPAPAQGIRNQAKEIQHRWRYAQAQRAARLEEGLADPALDLLEYLEKSDLALMLPRGERASRASIIPGLQGSSGTVFLSGDIGRHFSALKQTPKSDWASVLRERIKQSWVALGENNWAPAFGEPVRVSKVITFEPEAFAATRGNLGSRGHLVSYDVVIPSTAKKLYKRHGMKIEPATTHVPSGRWLEENQQYVLAGDPVNGLKNNLAFEHRIGNGWSYEKGADINVNLLEFTDDFKSRVLESGQPYYQIEESVKKGAVRFLEDNKAILYLFRNADASTFIHEMGHIMRRQLPKYQLQAAERFAGVKDGKWTVEAEEKFARAFERFVYDHVAPQGASKELIQAFSTLKTSMKGIYEELRGSSIDIELSAGVERLFANMSYGRGIRERLAAKLADDALTGRQGVVRKASEAGLGERTLVGMTEGIGPFNKDTATMYRLKGAVQGVQTEAEAISRVREVLWKLYKGSDNQDLSARYVERLSKKIGRRLFESESPASPRRIYNDLAELKDRAYKLTKKADATAVANLSAREEWVRKKTVDVDAPKAPARLAELEAEMNSQLSLRLPSKHLNGADFVRELNDWEKRLWLDFNQLTKNLTKKDKLLAAFSALRELPNTPDSLRNLWRIVEEDLSIPGPVAKEWAMGQRLGPANEAIAPVVSELKNLISRYEKMYEENGMKFMANPTIMLQRWGVVDYFPHMWVDGASVLTPAGSQRAGGLIEYTRRSQKVSREPVSLDERLLSKMDASKQRGILGTIREINMQLDSGGAFGVDPLMIAGRYLQANQKITAQQFLFALIDTGVIEPISALKLQDGTLVPATKVASERGYIPLLARDSDSFDLVTKEQLLFGERLELAHLGVTDTSAGGKLEELLSIDRVGKEERKAGAFWSKTEFANWATEASAIKRFITIEDAIAAIRFDELKTGKPKLTNVRELVRTALDLGDEAAVNKALDMIAESLSSRAHGVTKERYAISGRDLRSYFAPGQEGWRLYIPQQVVLSMNEILGADLTGRLGGLKGALDKIQNFWKIRLTVTAIAFHARNGISNIVQNWLHLDSPTLLSPSMNMKATGLALATSHYEKYGSMVAARRHFDAPKGKTETTFDFARRKASGALFESTFGRWIDDGIDLGDGVVRSLDESIDLMKQNSVLSESFTQYVDIADVEANLLEIMTKNGMGGVIGVGKRGLSLVEDAAIVILPMGITGGIPVTVPKGLGASMGRTIENQARALNFMGSLKMGHNPVEAGKLVAKFLFDYGDLTSFQKQWMRTIFPFFTWNNKNFWLQLDQLMKNPGFYSTFNHLMYEGLPNIANATLVDPETGLRPGNPNRIDPLSLRPHHSRHRISLPIPNMRNVYFEGLGLPQEGFNEWINPMIDTARYTRHRALGWLNGSDSKSMYWEHTDRKPYFRMMGHMNVPLRMVGEFTTGQHFFYDKPISELTNGRLMADIVDGYRAHGGALGNWAADYIEQMTNLEYTFDVDPVTGLSEVKPIVSGSPNWMIGASPYGRLIKQAGAYSDILALDLASVAGSNTSAGAYAEAVKGAREVPAPLRAMEALTGLRVVQKNPELERRIQYNRMKDFLQRTYESYNVARTIEMDTIESALPK